MKYTAEDFGVIVYLFNPQWKIGQTLSVFPFHSRILGKRGMFLLSTAEYWANVVCFCITKVEDWTNGVLFHYSVENGAKTVRRLQQFRTKEQ